LGADPVKLLTVADIAERYGCAVKTVREDIVRRPGFPKPIRPTGSDRLRLWKIEEVERWESAEGRRAA
jgi:predicted DNA-binding transcriptional regulator AlpA